jgi:hypothetical protein
MAEESVDLTTADGLLTTLRKHHEYLSPSTSLPATPDGTYCAGCGAVRRMSITVLRQAFYESRIEFHRHTLPLLALLTCTQCYGRIVVLAYMGPSGPEVVALPDSYGGLTTPHTPEAVAYYLDQAQRAQATGALSAAITMYRAALEQLLFEQGYRNRMLKAKIDALVEDTDPPKWVRDLDPEYLTVIKDLGNAAIHPNDGDITKQQALDAALVLAVRELFVELLDDIYEQPGRRQSRLSALREAAQAFTHAKTAPAEQSDGAPE